MKSLKIAALGVAALGFAAAPAFGAFADAPAMDGAAVTSHVDTINITVASSCTLGEMQNGAYKDKTDKDTDATEHASGSYEDPKNSTTGQGTWQENQDATGLAAGVRTDKLSLTMQPGTVSKNIGSTTFTVRCNNHTGYELKALAANSGKLAKNDTVAIDTGAYSETGSFWSFKLTNATGMTIATKFDGTPAGPEGEPAAGAAVDGVALPTTTAERIAHKTTAGNIDGGEKVTVTYGAGISKSQESGSYTGSVTYTLAQL